MILGYNTNGFSHHRLEDAADILAEIGYRSLAVTIERDLLDPPERCAVPAAVARLKEIIAGTRVAVTIETGSRYLLDPRRKHHPTLVSAEADDRRRRVEFLKSAVDIAGAVNADSVSLWSGRPEIDTGGVAMDLLVDGLGQVLAHAEGFNVRLSFEPEPGMFIETMEQFEQLYERIDHPLFGLTLDVGHVHCLDDGEIGAHVERWGDVLWNVHIEDMRRGVHEHLMFGDGDMDVDRVFAALAGIEYDGPIHVELSRHSHDAVETAGKAMAFLAKLVATR